MALQVPSTSLSLSPEGGGSFTLKGRSRAGDGTTFVLQELKWMFDMGAPVQQAIPEIVCLTHTHSDHIACMPQILTDRSKHTHVYLPAKAVPFVENYLRAHQAFKVPRQPQGGPILNSFSQKAPSGVTACDPGLSALAGRWLSLACVSRSRATRPRTQHGDQSAHRQWRCRADTAGRE